jgi:hypothetical protein
VSRAAFGIVDDSIVTKSKRVKMHTALWIAGGAKRGLFVNARSVNVCTTTMQSGLRTLGEGVVRFRHSPMSRAFGG